MVAYLTTALCLFADDDYEEVATKVTGALTRFGWWDAGWAVRSASGDQPGAPVLAEFFDSVAAPGEQRRYPGRGCGVGGSSQSMGSMWTCRTRLAGIEEQCES